MKLMTALTVMLLAAGPALAQGEVRIAPQPPSAAPGAPARLGPSDAALLDKIDAYLNALSTVSAEFLQVSDDGGTASGRMYLSRPGKMRFEYKPVVPGEPGSLLVADGGFIHFYDANQKQTSDATIESTLANFFLKKTISLKDGVRVTRMTRGANTVEITLVDAKDPGQGSLILLFNEQPLQLRQWRVLDGEGAGSTVTLLNPEYGGALSANLFVFRDPARPRPGFGPKDARPNQR